jgi:septum site-determining protein MinC
MIAKQKNLRVFHINISDKQKFFDYFNKNKILLKEFFLLVEGEVDKDVSELLLNTGVCFKDISNCKIRFSSVKKIETKEENKPKPEDKKNEESIKIEKKLSVYERPIRSGEEINEELPVVVFGRINSGAKLFCSQSVSIYGIIDGLVQCDGDYVVLNGIGQRGNLIFNGEIIEKERVKKDVLQKITMVSQEVVIKEI